MFADKWAGLTTAKEVCSLMSVCDSDCSDTDISRHSARSGSFICLPTYNLKDKSSMIRGFANLYSSLFISDDDLQFTLRVFKVVPIYKLVVQEKNTCWNGNTCYKCKGALRHSMATKSDCGGAEKHKLLDKLSKKLEFRNWTLIFSVCRHERACWGRPFLEHPAVPSISMSICPSIHQSIHLLQTYLKTFILILMSIYFFLSQLVNSISVRLTKIWSKVNTQTD